MTDSDFRDAEFVEGIANDVLGVLRKRRFFERLDDRFRAGGVAHAARPQCDRTFSVTIEILINLGMDADDVGDVLAVMRAKGAGCDCEILYNIASQSRSKREYWRAHAADGPADEPKRSRYLN